MLKKVAETVFCDKQYLAETINCMKNNLIACSLLLSICVTLSTGCTKNQTTPANNNNNGNNGSNGSNGSNGNNGSNSDTAFIQWQKTIGGTMGDVLRSIRQTTDGGYIVVGDTRSSDHHLTGNKGGTDAWIAKLNSQGAIEWSKSYGGLYNDKLNAVIQTSDGGYLAAGTTDSNDGDVTTTNNHAVNSLGGGLWIVKFSSSGVIQWQKIYGGSTVTYANSIKQAGDGYIVAGGTYMTGGDVTEGHGYEDCWILKLNNSGGLVWQKSIGGSYHDVAAAISTTSDGGYIFAGNTASGDIPGYHDNGAPGFTYDAYVVKMAGDGSVTWQKCLGGSGFDELRDIIQTSDGSYVAVGYTDSDDGDVVGHHTRSDVWLVKISGSGNIVWQKALGGDGTDEGYAIEQTTDGGYIMAGYTNSESGDVTDKHWGSENWLVKLSGSGDIQWQRCLGSNGNFEYAYDVQQTSDGGFVTCGTVYDKSGDVTEHYGEADGWVVKVKQSP